MDIKQANDVLIMKHEKLIIIELKNQFTIQVDTSKPSELIRRARAWRDCGPTNKKKANSGK